MYAEQNYLLSSKDYTTLECLLNRAIASGDKFTTLIRQKLARAAITFPADVPANVAVIGNLMVFRLGDGEATAGRLVDGRDGASVYDEVSIETVLGLTLLGMAEGDTSSFLDEGGSVRVVHLDEVRRFGEAVSTCEESRRSVPSYMRRGMRADRRLTLVAFPSRHLSRARFPGVMNDDDPGPSAA